MSRVPGIPVLADGPTAPESCWQTPQWLVARIRAALQGHIDLDPCTVPQNPTGARLIFTPLEDGLQTSWPVVRTVFVNPPFCRAAQWATKCVMEAARPYRPLIVFLGPAALGTKWLHDFWEIADDALFLCRLLMYRFQSLNRIRVDGELYAERSASAPTRATGSTWCPPTKKTGVGPCNPVPRNRTEPR